MGIVLGVGACGGGEESAGHTAAKPRVAERVLNQRELEHLVLSGGTEIGSGTRGVGNGTLKAVPHQATRPAACVPVLAATEGTSERSPTGSVTRIFTLEQDSLVISLAAYRGQDASRVMAELRTALRTCRKFPVAGTGGVTWSGIRSARQLGEGDQEVAFRGEVHMGSEKHYPIVPNEVHVIRVRSTIVTFTAANVTATAASPVVPRDMVHRQVTALEKAASAAML
ncbi:hypothetical protein OG894_44480 (plasmid) [Streptomyces sp. NBC_01724]|uniref:hypothetical protein n=1 Tax=Streptomyces sp. NBC_01724 TaxID=2975922 RepID=UPI002E362A3B|nr:hypothetical protein [Streptomyces sp. NBC_01724]